MAKTIPVLGPQENIVQHPVPSGIVLIAILNKLVV